MALLQSPVARAKWLTYSTLFSGWQRFWKYIWFILALQLYKLIALLRRQGKMGQLLEVFYLVNRYIDDIADADAEPNWTVAQRIAYLERKRAFTLRPVGPQDDMEHLILYYQAIAEECGESSAWEKDAICIIDSMLFDARRLDTGLIFTQAELETNYHLLDEEGTVRPMLRLFNEQAERYPQLSALAKAVRIYYNLRDLRLDFIKGVVNIGKNYVTEHRIGLKSEPEMMQTSLDWQKEQAREGLRLLADHRDSLSRHPFKPFTRLALYVLYEKATESFLKSFLAEPLAH